MKTSEEMTRAAAKAGLGRWTFVSERSNTWWRRDDGLEHEIVMPIKGTIWNELMMVDRQVPMDFVQPREREADPERRTYRTVVMAPTVVDFEIGSKNGDPVVKNAVAVIGTSDYELGTLIECQENFLRGLWLAEREERRLNLTSTG